MTGEIPPELKANWICPGLTLVACRSAETRLPSLRQPPTGLHWSRFTMPRAAPNWKNDNNWLTAAPIGLWHGVTADANGRVTSLVLSENQLSGEMPPELGSLANLRSLFLGDNQLTGEIPSELGSLANLERLRLFNNQLTGEIPAELGRLTNLTMLYLSGNQLTGCVPASLRDVADNDFAQLGLSFCTSQDPLITRYDTNRNGAIDRSELFSAIDDYFAGRIDRSQLFGVIDLYFSGY